MILLIDFGSSKAPHIARVIDEYMDVKTVHFNYFQPEDTNGVLGIVLSGAPLLVTEINLSLHLEKMNWLKTTELPVLGICFGHQLLGILHGAFASRMKADRDWQTIEAFEASPLLHRLPAEFQMMEDHCETISIPQGFELIASSDACVNEIMQHKTKPLFGVQFHPEVSGNHGSVLIENFVKICELINNK